MRVFLYAKVLAELHIGSDIRLNVLVTFALSVLVEDFGCLMHRATTATSIVKVKLTYLAINLSACKSADFADGRKFLAVNSICMGIIKKD
jgi:hypothetical protein